MPSNNQPSTIRGEDPITMSNGPPVSTVRFTGANNDLRSNEQTTVVGDTMGIPPVIPSQCFSGKASSSSIASASTASTSTSTSALSDLSNHETLSLLGQDHEEGIPGEDAGQDHRHSHPRGRDEQKREHRQQDHQKQHEEKVNTKMEMEMDMEMEGNTKNSSSVVSLEEDPILEDWKLKGRRGDPRMHKAVAARLAKPELSLFQALVIGGFKFPDMKNKNRKTGGRPQAPIYDSDNILLSQRKNQLSRRLRLHTRKKLAVKGQKHRINMISGIQNDPALNTILISNTFNFAKQQQQQQQQQLGGRPLQACFPPQPQASSNERSGRALMVGHHVNPVGDTTANSSAGAHLLGLINSQPQQQNLLLNGHQNHGGYQSHFPPASGIALGGTNHSAALQLSLMNLQQQQQQQQQQQLQLQLQQHNLAISSVADLLNYSNPHPQTIITTTNHGASFLNESNLVFPLTTAELMTSPPIVQKHQVVPTADNAASQKVGYDQLMLQQAMILRQKAEIEQLKSRQALSEANSNGDEAAEVKRQYNSILSDLSSTIANF